MEQQDVVVRDSDSESCLSSGVKRQRSKDDVTDLSDAEPFPAPAVVPPESPDHAKVVDILKQEPISTRKELSLLGRPVCAHSFRQLLGIGATRFQRLRRCALSDDPLPVDGRCRPREHDSSNLEASRKRSLVVDFLEEIYHSMSEPMPEADKQFGPDQDHPEYVMPKMRFRRNRGKNPGKRSRDKALKTEKLQDTPVRLLPPGTVTEYLAMLQAKYPAEKFTLKLLPFEEERYVCKVDSVRQEPFRMHEAASHLERLAKNEVANEVRMNYERLSGGELLRYVGKRRQSSIYRAAARLWGRGIPWNQAISIITEAFDATMGI
eukprot:s2370_g8.t1